MARTVTRSRDAHTSELAEALHKRYAPALCLDPCADVHEYAVCHAKEQWLDDALKVIDALTLDETGRHRYRLAIVLDREP